jgi:hypothetical protein
VLEAHWEHAILSSWVAPEEVSLELERECSAGGATGSSDAGAADRWSPCHFRNHCRAEYGARLISGGCSLDSGPR